MEKFILKINGKYLVDFKETESTHGKGSYCNGVFNLHSCLSADEMITSENKNEACVFEGRMNLKSCMEKIIPNSGYKFETIEIIKVGV